MQRAFDEAADQEERFALASELKGASVELGGDGVMDPRVNMKHEILLGLVLK